MISRRNTKRWLAQLAESVPVDVEASLGKTRQREGHEHTCGRMQPFVSLI